MRQTWSHTTTCSQHRNAASGWVLQPTVYRHLLAAAPASLDSSSTGSTPTRSGCTTTSARTVRGAQAEAREHKDCHRARDLGRSGERRVRHLLFPNAEVYGLDNAEYVPLAVARDASGQGVPAHIVKTKAVPLDLGPRAEHVHVFALEINSLTHKNLGEQRELGRNSVGLPLEDIDIVIDDADHHLLTQQQNFKLWFPRLRAGGLYIIEDILLTPTPWPGWDKPGNQIPHKNTACGKVATFLSAPLITRM